MIDFILIVMAIILSPVMIFCGLISVILIWGILYAIPEIVAECIRKLIDSMRKGK